MLYSPRATGREAGGDLPARPRGEGGVPKPLGPRASAGGEGSLSFRQMGPTGGRGEGAAHPQICGAPAVGGRPIPLPAGGSRVGDLGGARSSAAAAFRLLSQQQNNGRPRSGGAKAAEVRLMALSAMEKSIRGRKGEEERAPVAKRIMEKTKEQVEEEEEEKEGYGLTVLLDERRMEWDAGVKAEAVAKKLWEALAADPTCRAVVESREGDVPQGAGNIVFLIRPAGQRDKSLERAVVVPFLCIAYRDIGGEEGRGRERPRGPWDSLRRAVELFDNLGAQPRGLVMLLEDSSRPHCLAPSPPSSFIFCFPPSRSFSSLLCFFLSLSFSSPPLLYLLLTPASQLLPPIVPPAPLPSVHLSLSLLSPPSAPPPLFAYFR